jgi:hypothetical protein
VFDGFLYHFRAAAHRNDHAFGLRVPDIVEKLVFSAGYDRELFKGLADHLRAVAVEQVARFPRLEKGVRVLRRPADDRMVR